MDIFKPAGTLFVLLFSIGCYGQNKFTSQAAQTQIPKNIQKEYSVNTNEIKKHLELQDHLEKSEDGKGIIYDYSPEDMLIALPIISQGLIDNGFKPVDQTKFDQEIKNIFGDILRSENPKIRIHHKFTTVFAEKKR